MYIQHLYCLSSILWTHYIIILNNRAILAWIAHLYCVHQSCSVEGNDLNHLVEGNQAGFFPSIVFERITRPYPSPSPRT